MTDAEMLHVELALLAARRPVAALDLVPLTGLPLERVAAALAGLARANRAAEDAGRWALVVPRRRDASGRFAARRAPAPSHSPEAP